MEQLWPPVSASLSDVDPRLYALWDLAKPVYLLAMPEHHRSIPYYIRSLVVQIRGISHQDVAFVPPSVRPLPQLETGMIWPSRLLGYPAPEDPDDPARTQRIRSEEEARAAYDLDTLLGIGKAVADCRRELRTPEAWNTTVHYDMFKLAARHHKHGIMTHAMSPVRNLPRSLPLWRMGGREQNAADDGTSLNVAYILEPDRLGDLWGLAVRRLVDKLPDGEKTINQAAKAAPPTLTHQPIGLTVE